MTANDSTERQQEENQDAAAQLTFLMRYYARQAPNWRARRRRRRSIEDCTTDVQQRLAAAAEDLRTHLMMMTMQRQLQPQLQQQQQQQTATTATAAVGLTLPVAAAAWVLLWLLDYDHDHDETQPPQQTVSSVLTAPWRRHGTTRRAWRALARHVTAQVRHLRLVVAPTQQQSWPSTRQSRNRDFVGATTTGYLENYGNDDDTAATWLAAYHAWQMRPTLALHRFADLQFVWLDGVPAECVTTLPVGSLKVLRLERCGGMESLDPLRRWCLQDQARTTQTPTPSTHPSNTPLVPGVEPQFTALTHLKLVHCNLVILTYMDNEQDGQGTIRPILPLTCPGLKTLNLAHNALTDAAISQAGLHQLPALLTVDLSYNQLRGIWHFQAAGGPNWTRLYLQHNQIRVMGRGITRLYGLEVLDLRDNRLTQLSTVARLARLPLLHTLQLRGNPVVTTGRRRDNNNSYHVVLWDLFREARGDDDEVLPVIDGHTAAPFAIPRNRRRGRTIEDRVVVTDPQPVIRHCPRRRQPVLVPSLGTTTTAIHEARPSQREAAAVATIALQRVTGPPLLLTRHAKHQQYKRIVDFDAWQVLESLPVTTVVLEAEPAQAPACEDDDDKDENEVQMPRVAEQAVEGETIPQNSMAPDKTTDSVQDESIATELHISRGKCEVTETDHQQPAPQQQESIDQNSNIAAVHDAAQNTPTTSKVVEQSETNQGTKEPSTKEEALEVTEGMDKSQAEQAGITESDPPDATTELTSSESVDADKKPSIKQIDNQSAGMTPKKSKPPTSLIRKTPSLRRSASSLSAAESESGASSVKTPSRLGVGVPPSPSSQRRIDPSPSSMASPARNSSFHVAFPDHVWQDETNSLAQSSTVVSFQDTAASEDVKAYEMAENKSTFVGPPNYKPLTVRDNLDLYFKLFVFSQAAPSMSSSFLDTSMDGVDWQTIVELYPRIQLWPIDRRIRDATTPDDQLGTPQETFCRVWIENVVACGKPALRRLTPNLTARLGFHGELTWSTNAVHLRQEAVSTHRQVILCFSSAAFYVILDHDAVTEKAKKQKRRFPLPLAPDACFSEAKWPHALARHPFAMLRKIIIGFGFQRVTLRFSNSSFPSPEDFTYVILTGNKMKTVDVLKDLQKVATEAKRTAGCDQVVLIENDDPQVLDALGEALAPDMIGVVFHYQILEQRWKHGDRQNVRRVVVVTDTNVYLLDEDYLGDGAKKDTINVSPEKLGFPRYRLVDSAALAQIGQLHTGTDPTNITVVVRPTSRLSRTHNWRLVCRDREGQERLVEDIRKALSSS